MPFAILAPSRRSQLAEDVARDGIVRHEHAVRLLVAELQRLPGMCTVLLDVLADARAPAVARERALGRLLVAAARVEGATTRTAPVASAA